MTSHAGRLYALAAALLTFFLAWAAIAARPWASSAKATRDPRLVALATREHRLRTEAGVVQQIVARRFASYRQRFAAYKAELARRQAAAAQLAAVRQAAPAAAPAASYGGVRVVSLPPLVITRTS